jgi:glycosyltransferase involved in cell wall biosynthesis
MGGGSLRMYQMIRFLGRRFDLDLLLAEADGAREAAGLLAASCRDFDVVPPARGKLRRRLLRLGPYEKDPALAAAVRRRLASERYQAVHAVKPATLPYVPRGSRVPLVLDLFAYGLTGAFRALARESGILTRMRNLLRLARFAAFDAVWPETYCLLVVSEEDAKRCRRQRPQRRVLVIPNGVDCDQIRPSARPVRDPAVLLFTGDMTFEPNVLAAELLASDILPRVRAARPEVELHLVGRNPGTRVRRLQQAGVVVTADAPDMLPHLQRAWAYVAPLHTGAGTRTKLLEAMAAGLPIVTTTVGIEGIQAVPGRDVLIVDETKQMVAVVGRLLSDLAERQHLAAAARRVAERYDWSACLAPLEPLYAELLRPGSRL